MITRSRIYINDIYRNNCICARALDVVVVIICVVIVRIIYLLSCISICIQKFIVNIDQAFSIERIYSNIYRYTYPLLLFMSRRMPLRQPPTNCTCPRVHHAGAALSIPYPGGEWRTWSRMGCATMQRPRLHNKAMQTATPIETPAPIESERCANWIEVNPPLPPSRLVPTLVQSAAPPLQATAKDATEPAANSASPRCSPCK